MVISSSARILLDMLSIDYNKSSVLTFSAEAAVDKVDCSLRLSLGGFGGGLGLGLSLGGGLCED